MISTTEMIINEKYIQDIDDEDDESEVIYTPNKKVVFDKNTFDHHIIIEIEDAYLRITPTKYQSINKLKFGRLTYGMMNDIYDSIDSYIESIMAISDYKINIKMHFKEDCYPW